MFGCGGIAGNEIGDEGAAAVAEALKQNSTLSSLNLSSKWVWRGGRAERRRSGLRVMGVEVARREGRLSGCLLMVVGLGECGHGVLWLCCVAWLVMRSVRIVLGHAWTAALVVGAGGLLVLGCGVSQRTRSALKAQLLWRRR